MRTGACPRSNETVIEPHRVCKCKTTIHICVRARLLSCCSELGVPEHISSVVTVWTQEKNLRGTPGPFIEGFLEIGNRPLLIGITGSDFRKTIRDFL